MTDYADVPIGDAITIAYVDVVHAHSELIHIDWENATKEEILAEVLEAMHDLENAMKMMKPHLQTGEPPSDDFEPLNPASGNVQRVHDPNGGMVMANTVEQSLELSIEELKSINFLSSNPWIPAMITSQVIAELDYALAKARRDNTDVIRKTLKEHGSRPMKISFVEYEGCSCGWNYPAGDNGIEKSAAREFHVATEVDKAIKEANG